MRSEIEGFEVGFHNSLSEPITIGGVPRAIAILNGTATAIITLGLQLPWLGLPLGAGVHGLCYVLTKRDPYVFENLRRHLRHKPHFDA